MGAAAQNDRGPPFTTLFIAEKNSMSAVEDDAAVTNGPFAFMFEESYNMFDDEADYTGLGDRWPGALVLADCLAQCYSVDRNESLLAQFLPHPREGGPGMASIELGAGSSGWPSLALAETGCFHVLCATDGNDLSLNNGELAKVSKIVRAELAWGDDSKCNAILTEVEREKDKFDLVLAAEVLYSLWEECFQLMLRSANRLLSDRPGSCFVMQVSQRRLGSFSVDHCRSLAEDIGFTIDVHMLTHVDLYGEGPQAASPTASSPSLSSPSSSLSALSPWEQRRQKREEWASEHKSLGGCIVVIHILSSN